MKKLFILSLFALGCSPARFCAFHYPPVQSDSIKTVISYECEYDTVKTAYETIRFDTAFLPADIAYHKEETTAGLTAQIDIKQGHLIFRCTEDSLKQVIEYQKKIINTTDKRMNTNTVPEYSEHWYHAPLIWQFFIFLFCIILFIAWKYLKLSAKI